MPPPDGLALPMAEAALLAHLMPSLQEAWDTGSGGVLDAPGAGYVQWAKWPEGLQIECSATDDEGEPRSFLQRRLLQKLGFVPPDGDHPNFLRRYYSRDDLGDAAQALTRVMLGALNAGPPPLGPVDHGPALLIAPLAKCDPDFVARVVATVVADLEAAAPVAVIDVYGALQQEALPQALRLAPTEVSGARLDHHLVVVHGFKRLEDVESQLLTATEVAVSVRQLRGEGRRVLLIGPALLDETLWLYQGVGLAVAQRVAVLGDDHSLRTWAATAATLLLQARARVSNPEDETLVLTYALFHDAEPAQTEEPIRCNLRLDARWRDSPDTDALLERAAAFWCEPRRSDAVATPGLAQPAGQIAPASGVELYADRQAIDPLEAALDPLRDELWRLRADHGFSHDPLHGGCGAPAELDVTCVEELADVLLQGLDIIRASGRLFPPASLYVGDLFLDLFETIASAVAKVSEQIAPDLLLRLAVPLIDLLAYSQPMFMDVGQRNVGALGVVLRVAKENAELAERIGRHIGHQDKDVQEIVGSLRPPLSSAISSEPRPVEPEPSAAAPQPGPAGLTSARTRVADMWDQVVADWIDGRRELPPRLQSWKASYTGAVDERWYPDPVYGDLRGETLEPKLVVLGLNPGVGYPQLQAADGVWAQRIRATTYSRCLDRVAYDDPAWLELHGRNSPYWNKLMHFGRRWTRDDALLPGQVLNFELYPWHSDRVQGRFDIPPDLLDKYVWAPIGELKLREVFAYGKAWFDICAKFGWPLLARYGPQHEPVPCSDTPGWNLAIFAMPTGQRAVISWQSGYAGPPGPERTECLRSLLYP